MEQLPAIITKARARLLVRAPFIGSIALGLAWVNAPDIGTMATDGRSVWFNPEWCERHGVEKTMGVIAHEVLHVVNRHHLRRGERDAELWNVAADLLINRLLEDDKYVLPPDGLFDRDRRYAGLPTETIYARLLEQQQQQAEQPKDRRSSSQASAGGASGSGNGHDPAASGQIGSHAKPDQGEPHTRKRRVPGTSLGRGPRPDQAERTTPQPDGTAPGRARSRCPDSPGRSGSKTRGQVRHRASGRWSRSRPTAWTGATSSAWPSTACCAER